MPQRPMDPTTGNVLTGPPPDSGAAGYSGNGVPGPAAAPPPAADPYQQRLAQPYNQPGDAVGPDGLTYAQRQAMYANPDTNPWMIGASQGMTYDPDTIFSLLKRAAAHDQAAISVLKAIDLQPGEQVADWAQRRKLDQYAGGGARSAYYHDPLNASPDVRQSQGLNPYRGERDAQANFGWWSSQNGRPTDSGQDDAAYRPPSAAQSSSGGGDSGKMTGQPATGQAPATPVPNSDQRAPAVGATPSNDGQQHPLTASAWFQQRMGGR